MWGNFSSIAKNLSEQAGLDVNALNHARETFQGHLKGLAGNVLQEHAHPQQSNVEKQLHSLLSLDSQIGQAENPLNSQQEGFDQVPLEENDNGSGQQGPAGIEVLQALRAENEQLRKRLTAVEGAAADALGELEDLQERMAAEKAARAASERAIKQANEVASTVGRQADEEVAKLQSQLQAQAAEMEAQLEANQKLQARVQELHDTAKRLDSAGRRKAKEVMELKRQLVVLQEGLGGGGTKDGNEVGSSGVQGESASSISGGADVPVTPGHAGGHGGAASNVAADVQLKEVEQQLESVKQQAEAQVKQLQQQLSKFKARGQALLRERNAAVNEVQEARAQIKGLQHQLQQEQGKHATGRPSDALLAQAAATQGEMEKVQQQLADTEELLRGEVQQLQQRLQAALDGQQQAITTGQGEIQQLRQELQAAKDAEQQLQQELQEAKNAEQQLQQERQAAKDALQQLRQALQAAKHAEQQLQHEVDGHHQRIQQLEGQLRASGELQAQLQAAYTQHHDQRQQLQPKVQGSEQQQCLADASGAAHAQLQRQISDLAQELQGAMAPLEQAMGCSAHCPQHSELDALLATALAITSSGSLLPSESSQLASGTERSNGNCRGESSLSAGGSGEQVALQEQVTGLQTQLATSEDKVQRLGRELDSFKSQLDVQVPLVASLEAEVKAADRRVTAAEEKAKEAQANLQALTGQLEQARGARSSQDLATALELQSARQRLQAVEQDLAAAQQQVASLSSDLAQAREAAEHASKQHQRHLVQLQQQLAQAMESGSIGEKRLMQELEESRALVESMSLDLQAAQQAAKHAQAQCKQLEEEIVHARGSSQHELAGLQKERDASQQQLRRAQSKVVELEGRLRAARDEAGSLHIQVQLLQDSLHAEKDATAAVTSAMKAEMVAAHKAEKKVLEETAAQAAGQAHAREASLQAQLEAALTQVSQNQAELEMLQAFRLDSDSMRTQVQQLQGTISQLQQELARAGAESTDAKQAKQAAEQTVKQLQAEAAERKSKFLSLQRGFKVNEDNLREQIGAAQAEADQARNYAAITQDRAHAAEVAAQNAVHELSELQGRLADAHAAHEAALLQAEAQSRAASEAEGRAAKLEADLQAERSSRAVAQSDDSALRHDFERLLAAAIAAREEAAEHRLKEAEEAVEAAAAHVREAEARASAAEEAKIELTLALARSDDELRAVGNQGVQPPTSSAQRHHVKGIAQGELPAIVSELQSKIEEADLAAAVQTRRAGKAENELETMRAELAEAQRQIRELGWQIKMAFDPNIQPSTSAEGAQQPGAFYKAAGMLDILGCGANFKRPK